jgi:hypothetical protein
MERFLRFNEHNELLCPACGSGYLHQGKVVVFNPETEDAKEGVKVEVDGLKVRVEPELKGNPSPRRQGLLIHFLCEECDEAPAMVIAQHKGNTIMRWPNMRWPK